MLAPKYQIFISSTYTDLLEPRAKVRDAILSMYNFPVGMELFGAANEEQWPIIKETIDSSDYYVLIVGQRYGTVIESGECAGISYTEREFRYALEKKVPVLAFIMDDDVPVKPADVEKDNPEKLKEFKAFVMDGRLVDRWKNSDELAQKVTVSLYKQISRTKRPGWIRGDTIDVEKSLKTITELMEDVRTLEKENNELRQENHELKQTSARMPKLVISLMAETPDDDEEDIHLYEHKENIHTDEDEKIHLKVLTVNMEGIKAEYAPVKREDFWGEIGVHLTDEDIRKYNEALPEKEVLDAYLEKYAEYHMAQDCGIATVLTVDNVGNAKATDISATIEFPKEICVWDIEDIKSMKEPEAPQKPRDLEEVAYERAHRSEVAAEKAFMRLSKYSLDSFGAEKLYDLASIRPFATGNTIYESVEIDDNVVNIETEKSIVHSKSDWFGGIYLIPRQKGEFKAKATLMCSEYEEPEEVELYFVCE